MLVNVYTCVLYFLVNTDTLSPLDLSDFPVLHRTTHSPFQQQQQQQQQQLQQLQQQLQQQLRSNNSINFGQNGPNTGQIPNSTIIKNFMLQLASSNSNLNTNQTSSNLMMNNNSSLQYGTSALLAQQAANQTGNTHQASKMWSNFGSSKDSEKSVFYFCF